MKHGRLYVNGGDYLMLYMRMRIDRRKEAHHPDRTRLLGHAYSVYVQMDDLLYNDTCTHIQVMYRIVFIR